MVIVSDMFLQWSGPTSQNSCDMSLQAKSQFQKLSHTSYFFNKKIKKCHVAEKNFFKTSNYEVVNHWYQNKNSEMHQIKIILNYLQKNCQNVTHVMYGIALRSNS